MTEYTEYYKGYTIKINYDQDPPNPREENYNARTTDLMICFHQSYKLGDKHNYKIEDFNSWTALERQLIKDYDPVEILPLYLYDHSGLLISVTPFSCPWDSMQVGFILMSKKNAKEIYGVKKITKDIKEKVYQYLLSSVQEYNLYLQGNVYSIFIMDPDGNCIESSHGYITDHPEELVKEAQSIIDAYIKNYSYKKHIKDKIIINNVEKSEIGQKIQERIDELKDGKVKITLEII